MSGAPRVLVTGAGGKTGRAVSAALVARGATVRAVVRVDVGSTPPGTEPVVLDQRDAAALAGALVGIDAVVAIAPNLSGEDEAMARALVAACRHAEVDRLVLHSVVHPQLTSMPHHTDKARAEEVVLTSGLAWTILQPNAYLQNLAGYAAELRAGRYPVPYDAEARLALVDLADVAEVAARCVVDGTAPHATLELSGPAELSAHDVAAAAARVLGRPVIAERVDPRTFAASATADADVRARLTAMLVHYDRHGSPGDATVLSGLLGRPPGTLDDVLGRLLVG